MGHGGKLGLSINFVRMSNDEKAAVRSYQESSGTNSSTGAVLGLASGKDVVIAQGTEFTAYVDGDQHLKKEAFHPAKESGTPAAAPQAQNPSHSRGI